MPAPIPPSTDRNPAHVATDGQTYGSELERKAAEIRARRAQEKAERERFTAQQQTEAATFRLALTEVGCPEHRAAKGKPCWKLSPDDRDARSNKAVCGQRIAQALGVAKLRREREAREARKKAAAS